MKIDNRKTGSKSEAKLFWNGRSQAVRLPKEFRFDGNKVSIRRVQGGILLEETPKVTDREESIKAWFEKLDAIRGDYPFPDREPQELAPIRNHFK